MYVIRSEKTGYKYVSKFKFTGLWLIIGVRKYSEGDLILQVEIPGTIWNLFRKSKVWIDEDYFFELNDCNDR